MNINNLILNIILFCSLFRFVLFKNTVLESIFDSLILILLILLLKGIKDKDYFKVVYSTYKRRETQKIVAVFILVFLTATVLSSITSFFSYVDFGFVKTLILIAIQLITCIFLYAFFEYQKVEFDFFDVLVNVFVLQATIQLLSFLVPSFHELTNIFRTDNVIRMSFGIRGLSLDRYDYFNLAGAYGLIYILLAFRWENWHIKSYFGKIVRLVLLIFGGMASARTAIFTLAAVFFVRMYVKMTLSHGKIRVNLRRTFIVFLSFFLVSLLLYFGLKNYQPFRTMTGFLLASFSNYISGRGFTTTSTDELFGNMYFKLDIQTLLLGEGHFTDEFGGYYMRTDAGYMRSVLYWGVWGTLLLFWFQLCFLNIRSANKLKRIEAYTIMIYILALNVKGSVLGANSIILSILFLLLLYDNERKKGVINHDEFS